MLGQPPYEPVFNSLAEIPEKIGAALVRQLRLLLLATRSTGRPISRASGSPLVSTVISLLVGYPIAYGMARARHSIRPLLVMLVILPFWTSFLIRVYAWIGILKPEGLLNQFLLLARR